MDCSEEVQCVSEESGAQVELKKGMSIFIDVSNNNLRFLLSAIQEQLLEH